MPESRSVLLIATCLAAAAGSFASIFLLGMYTPSEDILAGEELQGSCNVLAVQVHGAIVATHSQVPVADYLPPDGSGALYTPNYAIANGIVDTLDRAALDETIKAVIIDIDSPGGNSSAGNEIADAIERIEKPVVALIHDLGVSAGYLIAASTDLIVANKNSTVGSIGATYSYISDYEKSEKEGLSYVELSSGPFKDMLSPSKQLTEEERALVEKDLATLHADFIQTIARMRSLPVEEVALLADGSTRLGSDALSVGLIDEIGGLSDIKAGLADIIGEPVTICWQ